LKVWRARQFALWVLASAAIPVTAMAQTRPGGTQLEARGAQVRLAQPDPVPARVVISLSGGMQAAPTTFSDRFEFGRNLENASVEVQYGLQPAILFDGGIGIRLWQNVGAGVAVSHATRDDSADIDARIPHPFFFERLRTVTGSQSGINRTETAAHVQLQYSIATTPSVTLVLSAGPSWLNVAQELVTDVEYDETFPYDEATFRSAPARRSTASAIGFNAGAELRWMFARHVGAGGFARFTRATVDLETHDSRRIAVRAGGVQAGGGLRIAF
jgi:hypothetical protein